MCIRDSITSDDIAQRLSYVAEKEGFGLDSAAAQLIAVHADGGLRDALSLSLIHI